MIKKYVLNPIVVEAAQWTENNTKEILDWLESCGALYNHTVYPDNSNYLALEGMGSWINVEKNDWIILDANHNGFRVYGPSTFSKYYSKLEE